MWMIFVVDDIIIIMDKECSTNAGRGPRIGYWWESQRE
jgi:hypothetical protein